MIRLLIVLAFLTSCEDKVSEPTVEIVERPAACPPENPENEESQFRFGGITAVQDVSRTSARVLWEKSGDFSSYHIISKTQNNREVLATVSESDSEVLLNGLVPNTNYELMVRGLDKKGFLETNTKTIRFQTLPWPNYSNLKSLRFHGMQAITLGESSQFDLKGSFSISLWVKISAIAVEEQRLFTFHRGKKASSALSLGLDHQGMTLHYRDLSNKNKSFKTDWSYADAQWHHIALTYDQSFLKVFIDGQMHFTVRDQIKGNTGRHPAHLAAYTGIQKGFVGLMDEFSFMQTSFSTLEIEELYNQGKAFDLKDHSRADKVLLWYRLGDNRNDSEANIEDIIGTINGTPFNISSSDFTNDSP